MTDRRFYIQTSTGSHGLHLHIEDETSGETLADIDLTPQQSYDFMRGSTMHINGGQSPNLDRVGKRMVNQSVTYSGQHTAFADLDWSDRDSKLEKAVELAKVDLPGWESYEPRLNNAAGVVVVVRKWIEDTTCGATDDEFRCELPAGHQGNHADKYMQWGA